MFGKRKTEVLVAGAGPVGLFTAASLAARGLEVEVFDAEWQTAGLSYALALHPPSLGLLEEIGVAKTVLKSSYRVDQLEFHDDHRPGPVLDFTALESPHPYLTIVPQNALERALEDQLARSGVKVHWKHRLDALEGEDSPVTAHLERWGEDIAGYAVARKMRVIEKEFPVEARYVVGADGHASAVRRHLGLDYAETGEDSFFAVFEFRSDVNLQHRVHVVFGEDGLTSVLWPLPDGRCRWSFQLRDPGVLEGERVKNRFAEIGRWVLPTLDEERLGDLIAMRAPWFGDHTLDVIWSVGIRFSRRLAAGFGRGALWLTGDSAHLAGPVGVHSMNGGLAEGHDLAARLWSVLRENGNPGTLDEYSRKWTATWRLLQGLDGPPVVRSDATDFVGRNAARILDCTPALGTDLERLLEQVGLELPAASV